MKCAMLWKLRMTSVVPELAPQLQADTIDGGMHRAMLLHADTLWNVSQRELMSKPAHRWQKQSTQRHALGTLFRQDQVSCVTVDGEPQRPRSPSLTGGDAEAILGQLKCGALNTPEGQESGIRFRVGSVRSPYAAILQQSSVKELAFA